MDIGPEAEGRLKLLPPIRRARLWRLYAEARAPGGLRRFLDLWMDGGRGILGAKGRGLGTAVKAAVDMGLAEPMPSVWERRLEKALLAAYPGYSTARLYRNPDRALAALALALDKPASGLSLLDPAMRDTTGRREGFDAILLRPFAEFLPGAGDAASDGTVPPFGLPLLPCPAAFAPGVLLIRGEMSEGTLRGEATPPLTLVAASRALRELALLSTTYREALWKTADRRLAPFFERRGPYLYPRHPADAHDAFFRKALEAGLLVSPEHSHPSLIPADFDDGELAALARQFK